MPGNNNIREIKTRLSLDGETAFRKSLKSVDSSLSAMKAEMKNLSTSFDESTDAMAKNEKKSEILKRMQEQLKIKVDALAGAVVESKTAYDEARKKAEELTKEYGENSEKAKIAWAEVETLGNKMDRMATMSFNAKSKLNDVDKQLRDLETPLKNASEKADDATENIDDMGKKAEGSANDGFTVLKGAAADLVSEGLGKVFDITKDVIAEFGNLDTVTNNFAIKTGASAAEMQGYSDSLNSLYNKGIGDSLGGISDSMAIVKQSLRDLPTDGLEEVTEYVLSLEDAFGYDAAESMRAANSLVDQFGIAYSDAFDLIVQGAQQGLDQNGDLLDVINEYSVQFKDMGYNAEEMFNMLSNAAESGTWSVDELGNAVKEFNIKLSEGSADEALGNLGINIDEVKSKFAEGGESAKSAQQEIITALMGVEDENQRYILGQQLMGTMWEDLGETTVAALFNTQGEISTTKDAMQEVIDLQYDDIGSKLEKVGRQAKSEIVKPLVEKALPKIEDGIEWVSENLDDLVPVIETVGTVAVAAFASKKIYDFGSAAGTAIKSFTTMVKGLTTATSAQTAANTALNATNPWGWVALAVAGVGALTVAIVENYQSYDDMIAEAAKLTNAEQEIRDMTQEVVDKYKDWKTANDTAIQNKSSEFGYYQDLKLELDGIVDKSGNIKKGYEERAKFITEKLSGVTGIEIEIVDGQIKKYDELSKAIENTLKAKQAEAYLGASESAYNEAITGRKETYDEWNSSKDLLEREKSQLESYIKEANEYKKIAEEAERNGDHSTFYNYNKKYKEARANVEGLYQKIYIGTEEQKAQIELVEEAEKAYNDYMLTIQNYENLSSAVLTEDVTKMNIALAKLEYGFKDATNASKEELIEQRKNYQNLVTQMENDLKAGMPGVTQESVNQIKMLVQATSAEIVRAESEFKGTAYESMLGVPAGFEATRDTTKASAESIMADACNVMSITGAGGGYNAGRQTGEAVGKGISDSMAGVMASLSNSLDIDVDAHNMSDIVAAVKNKYYPHFATGTDNFKGGFAVINENSKGELVNLPDGSQVVPHDISLRYAEEAASKANVTNNTFGNINISISAPNLNSQASARAVAFEISDKVVSQIAEKIDRQKNRYSSAIGR